jgi:Arc/MetJ family transcription regulator
MRTNIDIDDKLMKQAMKATGATTKKAAVEAALRKVVQLKKQERIRDWFGKIDWEGDLNAMRENRFPDVLNDDGKVGSGSTDQNAA